MIDIIKTPTASLGFSMTASLKKVPLGDSNNDRQPKMAAETGNTYVSESMSDTIEILTAKPALSTMGSSIRRSPSGCDNDRQSEMAM